MQWPYWSAAFSRGILYTKEEATVSWNSFQTKTLIKNKPVYALVISPGLDTLLIDEICLNQKILSYLQKQPTEVFCKKRCSWKFRKIHRESLVLESLFNKENTEHLWAAASVLIRWNLKLNLFVKEWWETTFQPNKKGGWVCQPFILSQPTHWRNTTTWRRIRRYQQTLRCCFRFRFAVFRWGESIIQNSWPQFPSIKGIQSMFILQVMQRK